MTKRQLYKQTDREKDKQTKRQIDGKTNRWKDTRTESKIYKIQIDRNTNRQRYKPKSGLNNNGIKTTVKFEEDRKKEDLRKDRQTDCQTDGLNIKCQNKIVS